MIYYNYMIRFKILYLANSFKNDVGLPKKLLAGCSKAGGHVILFLILYLRVQEHGVLGFTCLRRLQVTGEECVHT
jgi:hypothetical protein